MKIKFSKDMLEILSRSREEALRTGSYGMGVDHLMLGILRKPSWQIQNSLEKAGIAVQEMKEFIDSKVFQPKGIPYGELDRIRPTKGTQSVLGMASLEALRHGTEVVGPAHLLTAICRTRGNATDEFLSIKGIDREILTKASGKDCGAKSNSGASLPRPEDLASSIAEQLQNVMNSMTAQSRHLS